MRWILLPLAIPAVMIGFPLLFVILDQQASDERDPDYARYAAIFAEMRDRPPEKREGAMIDLGHLNGGAWTTACLFGGYTHPATEMEKFGAIIVDTAKGRGEVREFSVVAAYMDPTNRAHFVRFRQGIGADGQHLRKCVTKPVTQIVLDGKMS